MKYQTLHTFVSSMTAVQVYNLQVSTAHISVLYSLNILAVPLTTAETQGH
jgi:hypothetical protein